MKSIEIKFAEAMDALKKAGRTKLFDEKAKSCTTIEAKLNAAEAVLAEKGIVREAIIRKHNGAADNGNVTEFRESGNSFSAGYVKETTDPFDKADKIMFDSMLKRGEITEAQHRKLLGMKPAEYDTLTEKQRKNYDSARLIGFNESDSLKLARA